MTDWFMSAGRLRIVSALLCVLPFQVHAAPASPADQCWKQRQEGDIRACLGNLVKRSQADMDAEVTRALGWKQNVDPPAVRASQDAFLRYRDGECSVEGDTMQGGTNDADQDAACIIDKNIARTRELQNDLALTAH